MSSPNLGRTLTPLRPRGFECQRSKLSSGLGAQLIPESRVMCLVWGQSQIIAVPALVATESSVLTYISTPHHLHPPLHITATRFPFPVSSEVTGTGRNPVLNPFVYLSPCDVPSHPLGWLKAPIITNRLSWCFLKGNKLHSIDIKPRGEGPGRWRSQFLFLWLRPGPKDQGWGWGEELLSYLMVASGWACRSPSACLQLLMNRAVGRQGWFMGLPPH